MSGAVLHQNVSGGGYSVLHHILDAKGCLEGLIAIWVTAILRDSATGAIVSIETMLGREPAGRPIVGPDGEVTHEGKVFPGVNAYAAWFNSNVN